MAQTLSGKKVAILVTDGFEQAELLEPRKALPDDIPAFSKRLIEELREGIHNRGFADSDIVEEVETVKIA